VMERCVCVCVYTKAWNTTAVTDMGTERMWMNTHTHTHTCVCVCTYIHTYIHTLCIWIT
jgi:hypothetical protein